jgi:hypothetical protein
MSYIGAEPTTAAFPFDQFSGDGTTTAFTLTYAPASTTSIIVAISGVMQNPNLYSVVGTTLTFSPAPPTGTNNISVLYLGLPVIGSSSPGNTAFLSSTDLTATASQTVFASAGSYTPGFVQVYRNGARLGNADFTATNGTTITLANAATAGDLVTIEYYTLTSLTNALPLTGGTVTGSVTFNSAITGAAATFSGIVAANGGGIQFPATQVTSADANTLDDYEEGTWTVTATCGTSGTITLNSSFNTGKYTLVGNTVFFNAHIRMSAVSSPVGLCTFSLPFTVASGTNQNRGAGTVWAYEITATAGDSVVLQIMENSAGVRFATQNASDTYFIDTATAGMIKATTEMSITGFFYRA